VILAHRCQCGHIDFHHNARGTCSMKPCLCSGKTLNPEPETLPTWVTNYRTCDTIEVDYILDPGTRVKDLGVLCACPNCRAAFQAATGLEAAPGGEVEPDIDNFDASDTLGAWNGRINRTPSTHLSR